MLQIWQEFVFGSEIFVFKLNITIRCIYVSVYVDEISAVLTDLNICVSTQWIL